MSKAKLKTVAIPTVETPTVEKPKAVTPHDILAATSTDEARMLTALLHHRRKLGAAHGRIKASKGGRQTQSERKGNKRYSAAVFDGILLDGLSKEDNDTIGHCRSLRRVCEVAGYDALRF